MTPLVSIIIPCFNHGHFINEAIESVLRYPNNDDFEIIIVNDGSTDESTLKTLKELETKGYTIINQVNKGLGAARNMGIKAAKGKYILPLDCDNKIRPEYISESIAIFEKDEKVDVVYGDSEYFGEQIGICKVGEFNLQRLMIQNYIDACAIFRKSTVEKLGGYDEKMPVMGHEDWDLWLRIAFSCGKFHYINKVLFDYRYSEKSMVRSISKENLALTYEYIEKKHSKYLNRAYLNKLILYNTSKKKGLSLYLAFKSYFPRISNSLYKAGMMKQKDII